MDVHASGDGDGDGDSESPIVDSCAYYTFTQDDVEKTHISEWYNQLSKVTQKTIIIPIPPSVMEYLECMTCNLPKDTQTSALSSISRSTSDEFMSSSYSSENEEEMKLTMINLNTNDSSSSEDEDLDISLLSKNKAPVIFEQFKEFDCVIETAIQKLGGSVLPKLNWKAPKDAVWIGFNKSMRSYMPGDIYLLFKASNYITEVITDPYKHCKNHNGKNFQPSLILRKWIDINPLSEFRCFVVHRLLVAICQRDTSGCYPSIVEERDLIISDIHSFYRETLYNKVDLSCYVFDITRCGEKNVKLIDLNVFGLTTDGILFTYADIEKIYLDNLHEAENFSEADEECELSNHPVNLIPSCDRLQNVAIFGNPVFRFIESPGTIRAHPYLSSGAPHDLRLNLKPPVDSVKTSGNFCS